MNEELKIIIKAVTDNAKKAIKDVNEEIDKIKEKGEKSTKSFKDSMAAMAKSAAKVVGAIAAVTTALVAFGKSSLEAQRNFAKLTTAFQSVGGTAEQAGDTYKNLYRFMADNGAATEAAQQLALITTNEKDLVEWTKILQGVYATMGSTLPIESLAEAANETIKVGKVTGTMADALNWASVSEDAFNEKLAATTTLQEREALVRSTLNGLYMSASRIYEKNNAALLANAESQARLDIAFANAGKAVLPLMTAVNNLSTSLLTALTPAIAVVSQMLAILVEYISAAVSWIGSFFSLFSSGKSKTKEVANNVSKVGTGAKIAAGGVGGLNKALDGAAAAAKELKKQTMGFDELNVMQSQTVSGGGSSGGAGAGGASIPDMSGVIGEMPNISDFTADLDSAREKAEAILTIIGSILLGLGLWKIAGFISEVSAAKTILAELASGKYTYQKIMGEKAQEYLDGVNQKVKYFGGLMMIAAGAILLVQGYCDAWVNGIDWGNFAAILAGLGLIVGGLALAFGTVAAGVGLLAGGVALVVIGVKDFISNGYSMESVLTILAGVIAIVVGVCLAFNAALLANPITWVVIAIAALVAAFVILWNECDGFRKFWIELWDKVKKLFGDFVESIKPLISAMVDAFKAAWELIKVIWNDYLVPLFKAAWEAIKAVWDFVKPYFTALWESIKAVFSVVKDILGAYFKAAWEFIKIVWDQVVSYFTAIWESIALVFSVVKNVLSGNWQEAWDGIKAIVGVWKDYFASTWDNIKKVFSVVKTFFTDAFSSAWDGVKKVFSTWGSFFSGLWNTVKDTFSALGTKLGDAIGNAVKSGINGVISMIEKTINKGIDLINGAIKLINELPGVNISKMKKLSLPRLAKGGIVDGATIAMIGEQGKEAVMPLENNTEWIDKLADRIAARNSAPSKIVLQVGEKEIGWATIGAINNITKQTGNLPLVIV